MKNVYLQLLDELGKNQTLVLGTLLKTRGSTPQVPGASAIFNENGLLIGTLGGGIMEAEALKLAKESVKTRQNRLEEYSLNADINAEKGAICGGTATFLLDANPKASQDVFQEIKNAIENRVAGILVTVINKQKEKTISISRHWCNQNDEVPAEFCKKLGIGKLEVAQFISEKSTHILKTENPNSEKNEIIVFVESLYPKPELVIVGAGHVGQALCHMGYLVDFDVTLIDQREDLATRERFPEATRIFTDDICKGFEKINISENTYIVIVTQGHHDDAQSLKCCIKSNAAYIGMIGSKRKTALMREKFIADGEATKEELDKIYAPIGLDINSKTVNEIAVSVVAQLIYVRYNNQQKKSAPLIHCVVLAAGESKRMKQPKMLLPFNDFSIIETVVEKAKLSNAGETWVVLGSDKEIIEKKIDVQNVRITENRNYREGMLSSVQCGFNNLPKEVDAAVILLGDQPMVKTEIINQLMANFSKDSKGIIIPVYSGKRGHPILIDTKYGDEINHLNPETGLRELMTIHADDILEIEVETKEILNDIDTPEDYKRELINLK